MTYEQTIDMGTTPTTLSTPAGCTGSLQVTTTDDAVRVSIQHDSESCPIHEGTSMDNQTTTEEQPTSEQETISELRESLASATRELAVAAVRINALDTDVSALAEVVATLGDESEYDRLSDIREICSTDPDIAKAVRKHTDLAITTEYEVRVTMPVTFTIVVEGMDEDDARENVGEQIDNEVMISVSGVEEHDYDTYDHEITSISPM